MENDLISRYIDQNDDIEEPLKDEIKDTFGEILDFLGYKNFRRWVRSNHISALARNLIYKYAGDTEDEYLKNNPDVAGYHTTEGDDASAKDRIVVRYTRDLDEKSRVDTHETIHALARAMKDGYGGFKRFFGEGITEYLTQLVKFRNYTSYKDNVDTVRLVHKMFGDRFICYYLTGKGNHFFRDMAKIASKHSNNPKGLYDDLVESIEIMDEEFEELHGRVHDDDHQKTMEDKSNEDLLQDGRDRILTLYKEYEKSRIESLRYYKDGKVDFRLFVKDTLPVALELSKTWKLSKKEVSTMLADFTKHLIERSHLLVDVPESQIGEVGRRIINDVNGYINKVSSNFGRHGELRDEDFPEFNQSDRFYENLNRSSESKQLVVSLERDYIEDEDGEIDYSKIFEVLGKIKVNGTLSDIDFQNLLSSVALDYSDSPRQFKSHSSPLINSFAILSLIEEKYQNESADLDIGRIKLDCFPDQICFLLRKDDSNLVLTFNPETGFIKEVPLDGSAMSIRKNNSNGIIVSKLFVPESESLMPLKDVAEVKSIRVGTTRSNIIFDKDSHMPLATEYPYKEPVALQSKDFDIIKKTVLLEAVHTELRKNLEEGNYEKHGRKTSKFGKRVLDVRTFAEDAGNLYSLFGIKNALQTRLLCKEVIDKVYGFPDVRYKDILNEEEAEDVEEITTDYSNLKGNMARVMMDLIEEVAKSKNKTLPVDSVKLERFRSLESKIRCTCRALYPYIIDEEMLDELAKEDSLESERGKRIKRNQERQRDLPDFSDYYEI
ncbi:MAG: hypothetical protein IJ880_13160 [Bacilli bacterium]|nr:hypothetical protein [Bacilli bacterium]